MPENAIANLSWFFNVDYFEGAFDRIASDKESAEDKAFREEQELKRNTKLNFKITSHRPDLYNAAEHLMCTPKFQLQVEYPGLLVGLGYSHKGGTKGEMAGGFSLDYVTGLPYLPGSSVKGVLRSAFRHEGYIKELLSNLSAKVDDIKLLEKEIFDNADVFFDAYPAYKDSYNSTCNGLFEIESITPHHQTQLGTLAEPNPLTFLKVKPGVVFEFNFLLSDNELIDSKTKCALFKQIILDFGLGAKTNVGFGRFTDDIKKIEYIAKPDKVFANENSTTPRKYNTAKTGVCRKCGKATEKNNKTGEYFSLCKACHNKSRPMKNGWGG